MEFSFALPYQLFRKNYRGLKNVWFGSFQSLEQCTTFAQEVRMPAEQVLAIPVDQLPVMTEEEHHLHVKLMEKEMKETKARLLEPANLATKLLIKSSVKNLSKKRDVFKVNFYTFVH